MSNNYKSSFRVNGLQSKNLNSEELNAVKELLTSLDFHNHRARGKRVYGTTCHFLWKLTKDGIGVRGYKNRNIFFFVITNYARKTNDGDSIIEVITDVIEDKELLLYHLDLFV